MKISLTRYEGRLDASLMRWMVALTWSWPIRMFWPKRPLIQRSQLSWARKRSRMV